MAWDVQVSEEVEALLRSLTDGEFEEISAHIDLLKDHGPSLGRPYADTVKGSRHPNIKELRVKYERKQFRILFAFDPERKGILLVGGDKVPLGDKRWYPKFIGLADKKYDEHLEELRARKEKKK